MYQIFLIIQNAENIRFCFWVIKVREKSNKISVFWPSRVYRIFLSKNLKRNETPKIFDIIFEEELSNNWKNFSMYIWSCFVERKYIFVIFLRSLNLAERWFSREKFELTILNPNKILNNQDEKAVIAAA